MQSRHKDTCQARGAAKIADETRITLPTPTYQCSLTGIICMGKLYYIARTKHAPEYLWIAVQQKSVMAASGDNGCPKENKSRCGTDVMNSGSFFSAWAILHFYISLPKCHFQPRKETPSLNTKDRLGPTLLYTLAWRRHP